MATPIFARSASSSPRIPEGGGLPLGAADLPGAPPVCLGLEKQRTLAQAVTTEAPVSMDLGNLDLGGADGEGGEDLSPQLEEAFTLVQRFISRKGKGRGKGSAAGATQASGGPKGQGKGGPFLGKCWNCQGTGHRSADCPHPRKARAGVNALSEGASTPPATEGAPAASPDEWAFMGALTVAPAIGAGNRFAALAAEDATEGADGPGGPKRGSPATGPDPQCGAGTEGPWGLGKPGWPTVPRGGLPLPPRGFPSGPAPPGVGMLRGGADAPPGGPTTPKGV